VHVIRSAAAAGVVAAVLLSPLQRRAAAAGEEETVSGEVVSSHSRWARRRAEIVTESVIRTASGAEVTVRQLGGSVDGIGMVVLHSSVPLLRVGDRVSARVAVARDRRGRVSRPVREVYTMGGAGSIPFVRTEATKTRVQLAWESGCAQLFFDSAGTTHVEGDLEFEEMQRVLTRWRHDVQDCSFFNLQYEGLIDSEVGLDGVNVVKFREERWCRPATDEEPEECYDANAAALTTLHFIDDRSSDRNGTLLDADVEFNAINFTVAIDHQSTVENGPCESDLANTFTHEIGHLMGLDHTCWSGSGVQLTDDEGVPLLECSRGEALPEKIREATMYAFQDCAETKKASPAADDIAGVCAIYPIEDDPSECRAADLNPGGCCAVAGAERGAGSGSAWLLGLAGLMLLAVRRRR
jgi:MYXO-CTERM domain-containing protein